MPNEHSSSMDGSQNWYHENVLIVMQHFQEEPAGTVAAEIILINTKLSRIYTCSSFLQIQTKHFYVTNATVTLNLDDSPLKPIKNYCQCIISYGWK